MNKIQGKIKRQTRTRSKIKGTGIRPRLSVFKSNRFIYAQLINDTAGKTIIGVSEKHLKEAVNGKIARAKALGILLAKKAIDKKIKKVVFDKGSYAYHGRVSGVAAGAREGGLEF
ncbi:MAG: 50S ribosomal protein L18 [Candidatus Levybacteria bacterium RIFCSPLOWO2_01_FULL_39_24]|nr:MAG: 50S ribosomal protein L18 [Candidatus Levybacteria bacterium RIFCSPHIGHO2_01_FULL_40_16]OGH28560.1 MAG: 50S ribosomal protein L18 [Candidatus Levybacteria bacterium RIFCSPHIGHO2_12_FULL_39_9]OGH45948.1 MAG: 50S ribosomal protein L18 [Candidatus Levybacteria bacterium RIFCSPLOWO2_01_FULL_39_24]